MGRTAGGPKRFDADLKLRVLAYYDKVRNKSAVAKMFAISECSVRNWIKAEHQLRARQSHSGGSSGGVHKRTSAEAQALLEACIERYVQNCQKRGAKARYRDLLTHAAQLKKVHRVRSLKLSIDWVVRFVRERKLVSKCEKLVLDKDAAGSSAAACRKNGTTMPGKAGPKGLSSKHSAAKALLKRAKGQLSSPIKASTGTLATKRKGPVALASKLTGKKKVLKAPSAKRNDGKTSKTLSKHKPPKKGAGKGRSSLKKVFSSKDKKVAVKKPKVKAIAAGKKKSGKPKLPAKKSAHSKAKSVKSAAIVAKYKKSILKKVRQKHQKTGGAKNNVPLKKKVHVDETKRKCKVKKADKLVKVNKDKKCPKVVHSAGPVKKKEVKHETDAKSQKKACIIKKVVTKSLKKAKEIVNRAKKPAGSATSPTKQPVPKLKKLPPKKLKPRKQPIKVFRTRYRIKEMHRRIQENRSSDFFDFFYGLGLIPINRDSENSLYIPFITDTPKIYDNTGFICDISKKESPLKPSTSDHNSCPSSTHPQLSQRYPIWTPVRASTSQDGSPSSSGKNRLTSPRLREEHIISDRFTQPESPGDDVFFEKLHKASMKSEGALSPGQSPITPEQLAVVRKLFPPIGSLTFPSQRKVPESQVTFNEPLKTSERSLRPRSSEQVQRLSLCFRKRRYQRQKRTLSEPSQSPERRSNGPAASDIDWLSADSFASPAKKICPSGTSPLYCFNDPKPCFRKENFEDSASGEICGNSSRTLSCTLSSGLSGSDRSPSSLFDSAKFLINKAMPTSPKATSSSEGKDVFFGQAIRLGTLRKKQDKNEYVMHAPKGHYDH